MKNSSIAFFAASQHEKKRQVFTDFASKSSWKGKQTQTFTALHQNWENLHGMKNQALVRTSQVLECDLSFSKLLGLFLFFFGQQQKYMAAVRNCYRPTGCWTVMMDRGGI